MMSRNSHGGFDSGFFGLELKGHGNYRICVKTYDKNKQPIDPAIIAGLAREGVVKDKIISLPWIDERIVKWHWERFTHFLPTAGADDDDSSSEAEYRRRYNPLVDPEEVVRQKQLMCEEAARHRVVH